MRTQEFLDAYIQLGCGHTNFYKNPYNEQDGIFFPLSISAFWSKRCKINKKRNFDGKMLFKMKHFSFFKFKMIIVNFSKAVSIRTGSLKISCKD